MFVTPPLGDWVLVVGRALPYPADASDTPENLAMGARFRKIFLELAQTFEEVQFFGTHRTVGFDAWARARDGRIERLFAVADGEVMANEGAQTQEEARLGLLDLGQRTAYEATALLFEGAEEGELPCEDHTIGLAAAWSLDPTLIGEDTLDPGGGVIGELPPV